MSDRQIIVPDAMKLLAEAPVYALHPDGDLGDGLLPVSDAMINGTGPSAPSAVAASEAITLD